MFLCGKVQYIFSVIFHVLIQTTLGIFRYITLFLFYYSFLLQSILLYKCTFNKLNDSLALVTVYWSYVNLFKGPRCSALNLYFIIWIFEMVSVCYCHFYLCKTIASLIKFHKSKGSGRTFLYVHVILCLMTINMPKRHRCALLSKVHVSK